MIKAPLLCHCLWISLSMDDWLRAQAHVPYDSPGTQRIELKKKAADPKGRIVVAIPAALIF